MSLINQDNQTISVIVRDRSGILFEGRVDSLTSTNEKGGFDILPLHANFISLIHTFLAMRQNGKLVRTIELGTGVLSVRESGAEVYLGILHELEPRIKNV